MKEACPKIQPSITIVCSKGYIINLFFAYMFWPVAAIIPLLSFFSDSPRSRLVRYCRCPRPSRFYHSIAAPDQRKTCAQNLEVVYAIPLAGIRPRQLYCIGQSLPASSAHIVDRVYYYRMLLSLDVTYVFGLPAVHPYLAIASPSPSAIPAS